MTAQMLLLRARVVQSRLPLRLLLQPTEVGMATQTQMDMTVTSPRHDSMHLLAANILVMTLLEFARLYGRNQFQISTQLTIPVVSFGKARYYHRL